MAVGLEAELSATTRSQVEVTKILPDWLGGEKDNQSEDTKVGAAADTEVTSSTRVFVTIEQN